MKPIDIDVKLKYENEVKRFQAELKKSTGPYPVSLEYTDVLNSFRKGLTSAVTEKRSLNLDYSNVLSSFQSGLEKVISEGTAGLKNITANVTLDVGTQIEDLQNKLKNMPVELRIEYQDALNKLATDMANSTASVAVSKLLIGSSGLDAFLDEVQKAINDPQKGIQMFNQQSRPNRAMLVAYLRILSREMNKILSSNPEMRAKFSPDMKNIQERIDKELPKFEAGVAISADLDTSLLDSVAFDANSFIEQIQNALGEVSFQGLLDGIQEVCNNFVESFKVLPVTVKDTVDACLAEIERINNIRDFSLPELNQAVIDALKSLVDLVNDGAFSEDSDMITFFGRLGEAINKFNDSAPDVKNLVEFSTALTDLAVSMNDVASRADALMGGTFKSLLDAVSGLDVSKLSALTDELQKLIWAFSGSSAINKLVDGIKEVVDAVDLLPSKFEASFDTIKKAIGKAAGSIIASGGSSGKVDTDDDVPAIQALASDFDPHFNDVITAVNEVRDAVNGLGSLSITVSGSTVTINTADIVTAINDLVPHFTAVVDAIYQVHKDIINADADIVSAVGGINVGDGDSASGTRSPSGSSGGEDRHIGFNLDVDNKKALNKIEEVNEKLKEVGEFFRHLHQTGVPIPRFLSSFVGYLQGANKSLEYFQNWINGGYLKNVSKLVEKNYSDVATSITSTLEEFGLNGEMLVQDAAGKEEKLSEVWKKCLVDAEAYRAKLRSMGDSQADEKADKLAVDAFKQKLGNKGTKVLDIAGADGTRQAVSKGVMDSAFSAIGSGKGLLTKVFGPIRSAVLGAFKRLFSRLMGYATKLMGFLSTGPGIIVALFAQLAWSAFRAFVARSHEENKRQAEMRLMWAKQRGELELQYIKQSTQAEQNAIKANTELRKKQNEQLLALFEKSQSSYSFEVKAQERIYQLELQRLQAVKENEQIQQKIANINENINKGLEQTQATVEKKNDFKLNKDILSFGELALGKQNTGVMGDGTAIDKSVRDALGGLGKSISSFFTGSLNPEDIEKIVRERMSMSDSIVGGLVDSRIQTMGVANQSLVEELTTLQATASSATKKELQGVFDDLQKFSADMNKLRVNSATGATYTMTERARYAELMKMDANEAVGLMYDKDAQAMFYKNEDGLQRALNGTREEVLQQFKELQAKSGKYVDEVEKWYSEADKANDVHVQLLKERAILEQQINERTRKVIESQIKLREELGKHLTDRLIGRWSSFGDWRSSNAAKFQADQEHRMEDIHKFQLSDPRLLRNQDAKIGLQVQQARNMWQLKNFGQLGVQRDQENFDLKISQQKSVWDLEREHDMAQHRIEMENISKVANAQISNIKLQRDLIKRFMDHAVNQFKIAIDPYGRNRFDTQKELINIQIDQQYDKQLTELKKRNNTENVQWERDQEIALQDKVAEEESKQLALKQKEEEKWLKKKQDLELHLLEAEFRMRMKQIEAEVKYKHQLEKAQKEMESSGTDEVLGAKDITVDELKQIDKDISDNASPEEIAKVVANLSQEDKNKIAQNRLQALDTTLASLKEKMEGKTYTDEQGNERTINLEKDLERMREEALKSDDTAQAVKDAIVAVRDHKETATIDQLNLVKNLDTKNTIALGREFYKSEYEGKANETKSRKEHLYDEYNERSEKNKQLKEHAEEVRQDYFKQREEFLKNTTNSEQKELKNKFEERQKNLYNVLSNKDNYEAVTDQNGNTVYKMKEEVAKLRDSLFDDLRIKNEDTRAELSRRGTTIWGAPDKGGALTDLKQRVERAATVRFVTKNEQKNQQPTYVSDELYDKWLEYDSLKSKGKKEDEALAEMKPQLDEEAKGLDKELQEELAKQEAFSADLDELAKLGDAETAAIMRQTEISNANDKIEQELLKDIVKAVSTSGVEDAMKELKKFEAKRDNAMDNFNHQSKKTIETIQTQGKADIDIARAEREDRQEAAYAQIEAQKEIKKAMADTVIENRKRQDQFNAGIVKREADYRQTQRGNETNLAVDLMHAKTGTDRLKALAKYNAESDYNAQSTAMDERHKAEMEALMRRGNFTEEEKAQLEARQQDEKSSLDESKKYADAVRDAMGDVGGIRSLVTEGTGQTSGLTDTWERIQAAAFGHVEDPAADAVINLDRAQALQHAALMSLLSQQLPSIAQGIGNMNNQAIMNNYNNTYNRGTPPTVAGWS